MKLTTKGRYAIIAMVDLRLNGTVDPVRLKDVSKRQNISLSYLEQLFSKLRLSGLVKSVRGPGGGYVLNKIPYDNKAKTDIDLSPSKSIVVSVEDVKSQID